MSSAIKERALSFAKMKGISVLKFASSIGVSPSSLKGYGKDSEFTAPNVAKILTAYPDLSPDWLLNGEGEILRSNNPQATETASFAVSALKDTIDTQKSVIASLEAEIRRYREENMFYREKLKEEYRKKG